MDLSNYRKKMKRENQSKLGITLAVVVVITTAVFTILLAVNIVARSSEITSYYFNETKIVSKINTSLSGSQMAESISGYFNSFTDEPYLLMEKMGNNERSTFSKNDGYNLLRVKKGLDILLIVMLLNFAALAIVFSYLIRHNRRKALRDMALITMPVTIGFIALDAVGFMTAGGRSFIKKILSMRMLSDTSSLNIILGKDYMMFAGKAFIIVGIILMIIICLVERRIAREKKVFRHGDRYASR